MTHKAWKYEASFKDVSERAFGFVNAVNQQEATLLAYRTVRRQYPYLAIRTMHVRLVKPKE